MSGTLNGNYKHGRYSQDLPKQLAPRVAEALLNPALLSVSDDIAVLEARLGELLALVESGEGGVPWRKVQQAHTDFEVALRAGDIEGMEQHFATAKALVQSGARTDEAWSQINQLWHTRNRQVQTEVKTMQALQQMMTVQQHQLMVGALTRVVIDAIERFAGEATGRKMLQYIQREFDKLANLEDK